MIGRLLQTAATTFGQGGQQRGQQTQTAHQLESVTEEAHTRDLLFPDASALRKSQHSAIPFHAGRVPATPREAANYDDRGGLEVSYPTDVRVIIAQDQNARYPTQILFDSKPGKFATTHPQDLGPIASQRLHVRGKSFTSPQKPSLRPGNQGSQSNAFGDGSAGPSSPLSPDSRRAGLFGGGTHTRTQTTDFHNHNHGPGQDSESSQARLAREKEEAEALLNCIFGSPGMRLESGTKLHILPRNFPNADRSGQRARPFSPGNNTFRNSRTGSTAGRPTAGADTARSQHPTSQPNQSRNAIMVTKLFNVHLPETTVAEVDIQSDDHKQKESMRPDTAQSKDGDAPRRIKQKKTPMYAVAIIIQLPSESFPRTRSNPVPGLSPLSTSFQLSAPNSPRSSIQIPAFGAMDHRAAAITTAGDSGMSIHISYILAHWSLMSRNLHLLEVIAQNRLRHLLEHIVPLAPVPVQAHGKAGNLKTRRPKLPSQQSVYVPADAFQADLQIRKQADEAAYNVALGLRAKRVIPGQGRWGAWREEARWVNRWVGSREQNFFFFTFITAFLGQHTSWLEHLAPRWYARRAKKQKIMGTEGSDVLPQRTVIICNDKMAARRLVFLAASFLPTTLKTNPPAFMRPRHPSFNNYSESPPVLPSPQLSKQSNPRRMTARRDSPAAAQKDSDKHVRSVSFSVLASPPDDATEDDRMTFGEPIGRRISEAGSVRSTFTNLPNVARESSKGTTSTLLADSALPVAHFSNLSPEPSRDPTSPPRPGSNGSMASLALTSVIRRSESSNAGSIGRLGSMMSGFWSNAPESSTDGSSNDLPSTFSPERTPHGRKPLVGKTQNTSGVKNNRSPNKLERMVEETDYLSKGSPVDRSRQSEASMLGQSPSSLRAPLDLDFCLKKTPSNTEDKTAARKIPARAEPERMPITLSMNDEDGFVDVSVPAGMSINSSLASSYTSLRMSSVGHSLPYGSGNTTWNSSGDVSEHHSPYGSPTFSGTPTPKPEAPPNVAGWMRMFHPDFVLQAVRSYEGIHSDIRQALEADARLESSVEDNTEEEDEGEKEEGEGEEEEEEEEREGTEGDWKKICSILVADTTKFTVERHTIQRRKRRVNTPDESKETGVAAIRDYTSPPFVLSPSSSTASLHGSEMMEEKVITEPLMDMDPTLIEAIERVIAQSGPSSKAVSRAQSRVPSRAPSPARSHPVSVKGTGAQQSPLSTSITKQEQTNSRDRAASNATAHPQTTTGLGHRISSQVPFPECRKIIMEALEEIVKTVIEERDLTTGGNAAPPRSAVLLSGAGMDGTLREGVAAWLSKVEEGVEA